MKYDYDVYQQRTPIKEGDEWFAHLVRVGSVEAMTGEQAIDVAKSAPCFRYATGGLRYPIVSKVTA